MMPFADGNFIDGDLAELVQLGLAEAPLQVAGLDVLDGIPTDLEVVGHVLDGHVPRQFQGVALEGPGIAFLGVGESDFHLANAVTDGAPDPGDIQGHEGRLGANRHGAEGALFVSADPDILAVALRAAQAVTRLFDAEGHVALVEVLAAIVVANDAEGVVQ
jgi:hypothetical protein